MISNKILFFLLKIYVKVCEAEESYDPSESTLDEVYNFMYFIALFFVKVILNEYLCLKVHV